MTFSFSFFLFSFFVKVYKFNDLVRSSDDIIYVLLWLEEINSTHSNNNDNNNRIF